jgi:hypothetical protein
MTDKPKDERTGVLAAVMRLLARVPEPSPPEHKPRWRDSESKTPPDSLY